MKEEISRLIQQALDSLISQGQLPEDISPQVQIDRTRDQSHGDLASNIALTLAKPARKNPRELATLICDALPPSSFLARTEIAGPGFINFFLSASSGQAVVGRILAQQGDFGTCNEGRGRKVQVEFVSANPTGPLHVGHGRGAAVGDSICRLLSATGWDVSREFYYNDAGAQINNLALSVQARCKDLGPDDPQWPQDGYRGDYILESSLYQDGEVEATVQRLVEKGHTYEQDSAMWLRTTDFGDDKDRVMRKSDGAYTYFLPDVAYHLNKWRRGFERVINEQGADHHSTVTRVRAGLQALEQDIPQGWPDYVLHQMVTVMRDGQEVKISKRAGSYVTLQYLINEVGRDATRYFLAARAPSSQLTFDIDLALSQSNDNPVYYIQYAHARTCSVMRKLSEQGWQWQAETALQHLNQLTGEQEKALLRRLDHYPEIVAGAALNNEPHTVATYLRELAGDFHTWYNGHKMLVEDQPLRDARIALSEAVRQVIANGLELLGVSAPEAM